MALLSDVLKLCLMILAGAVPLVCAGQNMPSTAGETLSGKRIVLADATHGRETILVAGFSHEGGTRTAPWMKAIRDDAALAGVSVYEVAMLESAPGFVRGMIKSGMRKGQSPQQQDHAVVLTEDEKAWEIHFGVDNDQVPYVMLIDGEGKILWCGHGEANELEPQLRAAVH